MLAKSCSKEQRKRSLPNCQRSNRTAAIAASNKQQPDPKSYSLRKTCQQPAGVRNRVLPFFSGQRPPSSGNRSHLPRRDILRSFEIAVARERPAKAIEVRASTFNLFYRPAAVRVLGTAIEPWFAAGNQLRFVRPSHPCLTGRRGMVKSVHFHGHSLRARLLAQIFRQ